MNNARQQLDRLFALDAYASVIFGVLSLLAPHGVLASLAGGSYNHSVHETLRYVTMIICSLCTAHMLWLFLLVFSSLIFLLLSICTYLAQIIWLSSTGVWMDLVACPRRWRRSLSQTHLRGTLFLLYLSSIVRLESAVYRSSLLYQLDRHCHFWYTSGCLRFSSLSKRRKPHQDLWTADWQCWRIKCKGLKMIASTYSV